MLKVMYFTTEGLICDFLPLTFNVLSPSAQEAASTQIKAGVRINGEYFLMVNAVVRILYFTSDIIGQEFHMKD